jgi:hypothetical protein
MRSVTYSMSVHVLGRRLYETMLLAGSSAEP